MCAADAAGAPAAGSSIRYAHSCLAPRCGPKHGHAEACRVAAGPSRAPRPSASSVRRLQVPHRDPAGHALHCPQAGRGRRQLGVGHRGRVLCVLARGERYLPRERHAAGHHHHRVQRVRSVGRSPASRLSKLRGAAPVGQLGVHAGLEVPPLLERRVCAGQALLLREPLVRWRRQAGGVAAAEPAQLAGARQGRRREASARGSHAERRAEPLCDGGCGCWAAPGQMRHRRRVARVAVVRGATGLEKVPALEVPGGKRHRAANG
mmetsp:Transcript_45131/g.149618  ORF Transcript_45131/g.149618 Transcript_45131/m.149618 type:complete len:263 (-) Transcript_45131:520-1308(-)